MTAWSGLLLCASLALLPHAGNTAVPLQTAEHVPDRPKQSFDSAARRERFLEMMGRERQSRASHRLSTPAHIEKTFLPVIVGLSLSPPEQARLLQLLTNRALAIHDSRDDFRDRETAAKIADPLSFNPQPTGFSYRELRAEEAQAAVESENEIEKLVGATLFPVVREMVENEFELSSISSGYGESFEEEGHSLSAAQRLHLASVLHWLHSSANYPRRAKTIPLTPVGLTPVLEEALEKMRERLSAEQVELMRKAFILTERGVRGIPIEWERECELPANVEEIIAKASGQDGDVYGKIYITLRGSGKVKLNPQWNTDTREYCAVVHSGVPTAKNGQVYLMTWNGIALFYEGEFVRLTGENQVIWSGRKPRPKL